MAEKESVEEFELLTEKTEFKKSVSIAIHDFTKRIDEEEDKKKKIISPKFKVGETSLTVQVYPQDYREKSQEAIAVYLYNEEKKKVKASYTIKHASGALVTFKNQEIDADSGYGAIELLSHKAYKQWAKNNGDVFKVEVKITLHAEKGPAQWTNNKKPKMKYDPIMEAFSLFNNNEKLFTDFAILSKEGKRFPCHRLILSSQSQVMLVMMTTDMKEKKEGEVKLEYSDEVVEKFVDYFYTRTVPRKVLKDNLDSFLTLSELYDLAPLKYQTEVVAIEEMTTVNMVDMLLLSDLQNAEILKEASKWFIKQNRDKLPDLGLGDYPANIISEVLRLLI